MSEVESAEALFDLALGQLGDADASKWKHCIATDPETAATFNRCRNLLAPLHADAVEPSVPSGLYLRTLAAVAEVAAEQNSLRRQAPITTPKSIGLLRRVRRSVARETPLRMDVVVAASIALVVVGLGLGAVGKLRREHQVVACREELRAVHAALIGYADTHHGRLPEVGSSTLPRPGLLTEELIRSGQYDPNRRAACPNQESEGQAVRTATYSYTLGYRVDETTPVQGISIRSAGDLTPVAADLPPYLGVAAGPASFAHGGGQNVLFLGGSVRLLAGTTMGLRPDDIYRNDHGMVRAGVRVDDVSLGGPNDLP